jgi:AAA15 family ATPase/GTPase
MGNNENVQFIRTRNIDRDINGRLWDNITLTEKELNVIEALKIIEPNTERIAFIEESSRERNAVIKLSNNNNVVPLKSMGDGINRILTIILALVNADNGFLLIDEFENGLHHTVQEQLWNIIFNLSQKLNIQVFVTTHSNDCILGFQDVLNRPENILLGKLIRLDNENGIIKQVQFDAKELKIASDNDIEVR